jgi:hypothetical protein
VHLYGAGTYLTDGAFLYRVIGFVDGIVELEDCYRLDVVQVPAHDLHQRRLRVVTPAPASFTLLPGRA